MPNMVQIYVQVFSEGAPNWRPVEAIELGGGVFLLGSVQAPGESWEFPPGSKVRCRPFRFSGDSDALIAAQLAR
jgi:hypothetical protein